MAVTVADIAVALGRTVPEQGSPTFSQWDMWIADAVNVINWRAEELGVTEPLDPEKVDTVVRKAVVAHIQHPEDSTMVNVSVDDGSVSRQYRSGSGEVAIKDAWWSLLGLVHDSEVGSFRMFGAPDVPGPWS